MVLPRFRTAIFVHGCFWHGHDCPMFKWPATRMEFWRKKIKGNMERDLSEQLKKQSRKLRDRTDLLLDKSLPGYEKNFASLRLFAHQ